MIATILKILNLQPGDLRRGWPFFTYLFLAIASYTMSLPFSKGLFLEHFTAEQLPYANITVAAMVGVVVSLYLWASRRIGLKNLLVISLLFLSLNAFGFWWGVRHFQWHWMGPVLFVWTSIFGVLAPMQLWTLANFVWTTREAKRMFAVLGSGAIIGGILGGWLAKVIPNRYGGDSLLLIASGCILLCVGLVIIIWRQREADAAGADMAEESGTISQRSLMQGLQAIRGSKLLQTIAILICIGSVTASVAAWQFTAIASKIYATRNAYTSFDGSVTFYTGLLALLAQLLITSKILRYFGIGVALFVLPMAFVLGTSTLLIFGSLAAATFLRASDKVFRYSVDKSAMEVLYLPIPSDIKLQAKSFIDTVVWRFGDGLAGFTVLIFAKGLAFTPFEISWVNLVLLTIWLGLAFVARRQYIATLNSNLEQFRLDPQHNSAPVLDALTTNMFVEKLSSDDPAEVLYALNLFEMGSQNGAHAAVHRLLEHPSSEIRKKAVACLDASGDRSARALIAPLLHDENMDVRTEAMLYMMRHDHIDPLQHVEGVGDFADYSIRSATVAYLANPGESENIEAARLILYAMVREEGTQGQRTRLEAARLIGSLPDQFGKQIGLLMHDPDSQVVRHAIRAVGKLHKRQFAPLLVERLEDPELRDEAVDAILAFEDSIVGTLRDYLNDGSVSIKIRREIPAILVRIGTAAAMRILAHNLIQADIILRYRIIVGLNQLSLLHEQVPIDREAVETVMLAEIMGHYRSYQILTAAKGDPTESLRKSIEQDLERIFRLLKLVSPKRDLMAAYHSLQSKDSIARANALEFLDNTLKPQLRTLLVPLIDSEVTESQRAHMADRFLGVKVGGREEAIAALRSSEDPWLQSCALLWESRIKL